MQMHTYTYIYIYIHTYTCIYIQIHTKKYHCAAVTVQPRPRQRRRRQPQTRRRRNLNTSTWYCGNLNTVTTESWYNMHATYMRYDISYLAIFSPKWLRIHTHTDIYIRHTYNMAMIQTNTCRYCSGAQTLIASSHPSGLGQALNLGRAVIPWAGLPSPGEPGGRPGVMVTVTVESGVTSHVDPSRQWHRSARQWSTDCGAAYGQCRSDGRPVGRPHREEPTWNANRDFQVHRQPPRPRPRPTGRPEFKLICDLGHSRWVASDTRITQNIRSCESSRLDPLRPGLETPGKIELQIGKMISIDRSRCSTYAASGIIHCGNYPLANYLCAFRS